MSQDEYTDIRRFIVRYIQDQDFAENDGLPGRVLIQLCLERFYPDLEDSEAVKTEKKSIEGVIRRMVENSMLQPVTKNQKVVFRLEPFFNIKDKMNATASQPSEDPQSTQEALEALEKETSPDMEDQDMGQQHEDDDDVDQQLAQQLDDSIMQMEEEAEEEGNIQAERRQFGWVQKPIISGEEEQEQCREEETKEGAEVEEQQHTLDGNQAIPAEKHQVDQSTEAVDIGMDRQNKAQEAARKEAIRHAEAYREITRGAAPMPQESEDGDEDEEEDEDPIRTPGRKRRRLLEIAASDASGSMDPISPGKHPNSTPRRRMIRLGTPLCSSRRRSVPTGTCYSPSKQGSPRHVEQRIVKEERTDTSPAWLKAKVRELRSEYPNSSIISEDGFVKCLDCDGKEFRPAANQSLHGVMTHLRSKTHQANAARRQEKLGPSDCYFPITMPIIDFNMPQAPLMVFANQRSDVPQTLENLFGAIGKKIQNEVSQKDIRTSLVESRIQEAEKQRKQEQARNDALLAALDKQISHNTMQQRLVSKSCTASEVKIEELAQEVGNRVKSFETQSREYLEELEASMASSQMEYKKEFERMAELLDRNDLRNMRKIDKLAETFEESQKSIEERNSQLNEEIENLKQINEGQNVMISELERKVDKKTKHLEDMIESQNDKIQALQSQIRDSTQEVKKYQRTVEAQTSEIQTLRLAIGENSNQLKTSEETIKAHSERIRTLELQLKENMESFTRKIGAQQEAIEDLELQRQLHEDARQQNEQAMADQREAHLQQTAKQISTMKQEGAEQARRVHKLEQINAEQSRNIKSLVNWVQGFREAHEVRSKILDRREIARQKFEKHTSVHIRALEKTNKEQQDSIADCEAVIPQILEDVNQLVNESSRRTARKSATPVKTRASA